MAPSERPARRTLSRGQITELLGAHLALALAPAGRDPLRDFARRLHAVLQVKIVIAARSGGRWTIAAESAGGRPAPALDNDHAFDDLVAASAQGPVCWTLDDVEWTVAAGGPQRAVALAVEGDWMEEAITIEAVAVNAALVWHAQRATPGTSGPTPRDRLSLSSQALGRRLAAARGSQAVADIITHRMARAVGARFAALALPDAASRRLSFVATSGYPLELVEHLRIEPGTGIVGGAFQSGRVVHATGESPVPPGWQRRPRYRTESFIALPIRAGRETLGVLCVADRHDDQPFTGDDVRTLRALSGVAALALARERALLQAESYAHAAAVDPLTGVFNRRYFQTRLEEELERSRRHMLSLTLLLVDIDNFKTINDTHGHLAGDTVLRDLAEILRRSVRMFDVCARFGGEEFAIIMPGSPGGHVESVSAVAERIRERIEAYRSLEPSLLDVRITVSIGIGVSSEQMTPRELINRADQALYLAKRDGKNVVRAVGGPPN